MAYRSFQGNQFRKEIRKVKKPDHISEIQKECADIMLDPLKPTDPLVGNLALPGLRYRKIRDTVPEYRIMFMLYTCEFSDEGGIPTCDHNKCPVGLIEEDEVDFVGSDEGQEEGTVSALENDLKPDGPCEGLIKYALFGTRELYNNLYKLPTKVFEKMLK